MSEEKKGCGIEFDQDHGTPVYCGMMIGGILHLCRNCKKLKEFEEVGVANFGSMGK